MLKSLVFILSLTAFATNAFAGNSVSNGGEFSLPAPQPKTKEAVAKLNQFGLTLFKKQTTERSVVFSPYSLSQALLLIREGAASSTLATFNNAMNLSEIDDETLPFASHELQQALGEASRQKETTLTLVNKLWIEQTAELQPNYLSRIQNKFDAKFETADFVHQPNAELQKINQFVFEQTHEKIKDLFSSENITSATKSVIANALYCNAPWQTKFNRRNTYADTFLTSEKDIIQLPTMHTATFFRVSQSSAFSAIDLPFHGNKLSMLAILPNKDVALDAFIQNFSLSTFESINNGMQNQHVSLSLPKFRIESSFSDLNQQMSSVGLSLAFSPNADFSRMFIMGQNQKIESLVQKTFFAATEGGIEAAAATGASMGNGGHEVGVSVPFRLDRPFLFLIKENSTDAILFIGTFWGE